MMEQLLISFLVSLGALVVSVFTTVVVCLVTSEKKNNTKKFDRARIKSALESAKLLTMEIKLKDEYKNSDICFILNGSNIIIVYATVFFASLTVKEQKQLVNKVLAKEVEKGIQKYGDIFSYLSAFNKDNCTIYLTYNQIDKLEEQKSENTEQEIVKETTTNEKIEVLQDWKNDLLSGQHVEDSKTDDKKYIKK